MKKKFLLTLIIISFLLISCSKQLPTVEPQATTTNEQGEITFPAEKGTITDLKVEIGRITVPIVAGSQFQEKITDKPEIVEGHTKAEKGEVNKSAVTGLGITDKTKVKALCVLGPA